MFRVVNASPAQVRAMTGQTTLREFRNGVRRRSEDGPPGRLLNVIAGGTVTTFAARARFVAERPRPEVWVSGELFADIRVALLTNIAAHERRRIRTGTRGKQQRERCDYTIASSPRQELGRLNDRDDRNRKLLLPEGGAGGFACVFDAP
jgi:hypothetical protein